LWKNMTERIKPSVFARREGATPQAVSQWIRDGRITLGADGLLDPVTAHQERIASESPLPKHQANVVKFQDARLVAQANPTSAAVEAPENAADAPAVLSTALELSAKLKYETYRLQKAKAELANIEIDKAAGLLVDRVEVERMFVDVGATLRSLLESLSDHVTPLVLGCGGNATQVHQTLEDAAKNILTDLSDLMRRKAAALPPIIEDEKECAG
jgi:hypothetical protein